MTTYTDSTLAAAYSHFTSAANGDVIQLANGTYDTGGSTHSLTKSSSSAVVTFKAQNLGGAILTGYGIDLASNNTIFSGFDLQYSRPDSAIQYVTMSGNNCQMTRNKIHFGNIASPGSQKWVVSTGNDNLFDYNEVYNKTTIDDMFLAQTGVRCGCKYNYFHDFIQNPGDSKSEVLRYGNSNLAYTDFDGEVAYNRIETIDADVEVMSIKCTNVNIHHNTLINTMGSITLRQAYNCKVNNNILINSGIRAYGSGHEITKNQIIDNTGTGSARSLIMGSGDVEDLPVATTNTNYARFKNNTVSGNILANGNSSSTSILVLGDTTGYGFQPTGNTITYNIVQASTGTLSSKVSSAAWTSNTVSNNVLYATGSASAGDMTGGTYTTVNPGLRRLPDLSYRCAYYMDATEVGPSAT